jgi:hypothetical protein
MVIVSDTVQNVLNRIYLIGIAYNGQPPNSYSDCINAIEKLDKTVANIFAKSVNNTPFAWKRDNMLVCTVGKYGFSYIKYQTTKETIVIVEEVSENGQIVTENKQYKNINSMKNTMNKIRLTESQLHRVIKESVSKIIKENNSNYDIELQEKIYQTICNLEEDLSTVIKNTDQSSGQAFGGSNDKLKAIYNSITHIGNTEISEQAKETFSKLLEVISELQDIRIKLKTFNAEDKYWGHNFKSTNGTVGLTQYK